MQETGTRNLWLAFGLLIFGLSLTTAVALYFKKEAEKTAQREFDFITSEIQINIADRLADNAQVLFSGAALFDSSESVTRNEWRVFTEQLRIEKQLPGTQGVGFALLIPPNQLDQHIQQIRGEGFPEYTVHPEGDREIYSSIIYLEPFEGRNLRAFGYDMFSEPVRRAAMEQARDKNTAVLSGKVILVQETEEDVQAGTLMYVPVYRDGAPIETVEQRRTAIVGWVYSPYRMTDLMQGTLRNWEAELGNQHIHLQIYDGDVISADTLMYDSQSETDKEAANSYTEFFKLIPVEFEGHQWTLRFSLASGLSSLADYDSFWFAWSGGISFTILFVGLVLSLLRTQVNAQRIAAKLTVELGESEERYRLLATTIPEPIFLHQDGRFIFVNHAAIKLFGAANKEDLIGTPIIDRVHPNSRRIIMDRIGDYSSKLSTLAMTEGIFLRLDGSPVNVEVDGNKLIMNDKRITQVVAHDITKRKLMEDAIRASEQKYRLVFDTLNEGIALNEIVYDKQGEMIDYRILEVNEAFYSTADYKGTVVGSLATNLYGMTLEIIQQFWHEHKDRKTVQITEFSSPLNGRHFIISTSPFINGRFVTSFFDITERKHTEEALRDAYWRAESILEGTQAGSWEWNIQSGKTVFNERWAQIIGYTLDELAPVNIETWEKFIHPEDLKRSRELLERHFAGELPNYELECRMRHKDGRWIWVLDRGRVITRTSDGQPLMMFGTHQDITERKKIEKDLQAQRDFATQIINVMGQGLTVTDADGRFEFVNPAYARLFGYVPEDLIGKRPSDISLPKDHDILLEQRKRRMQGQVSTYESRLIRSDGKVVPVLITGAPREIDGKYAGAIAVITDLSVQKQIENKLRESEEKYRTVANFTYAWEAWRAPDGTYLYNSPSCERYSGHPAAEFNTNPNLLLEITHPDDQPILKEHLHGAGGELKDQDLEVEFRIITPSGETRWIAHSCTAVYSEDGHWLGRRESNRDISDRKRTDEELNAAKESLEQALLREQELSQTDMLTGLYNRHGLNLVGNHEIERALRFDRPLSVVMFDLDYLKKINDQYGHPAGDEALRAVAACCKKVLRNVDIAGRLGGDEFLLIFPETDLVEAAQVAERLRVAIENTSLNFPAKDGKPNETLNLSASMGVIELTQSAASLDKLISLVDLALYDAKNNGRNRVATINILA